MIKIENKVLLEGMALCPWKTLTVMFSTRVPTF